jgi:3'(2'), 5'-bisphosphate nucleotidase
VNKLISPYQSALRASIEASELIMEYYTHRINSTLKDDGSPVTEADIASSNIIAGILKETGIPIIGEESEIQPFAIRRLWSQNWCVDPLDGTKEYIKRNGEFAVNIALIEKGQPVFGIITSPVNRTVLLGGKDLGAYFFSFDDMENMSLWKKLTPPTKPNNPLSLVSSRSHFSGYMSTWLLTLKEKYAQINFIRKGSALKFFDLALGAADIYPRFAPTMEWDIASGQAIIEALGGSVLEMDTQLPLTYNKESLYNPFFVVRNKPLTDQL